MTQPKQNHFWARAMALAWLATLGLTACGSFEDRNIVLDLRTLAVTAEPPEQVLDVDFANPPPAEALVSQLVPIELCGLVANPADPRPIRWEFSVCAGRTSTQFDDRSDPNSPENFARCPADGVRIVVGSGEIENPSVAAVAPAMCATLYPSIDVLVLLQQAIEADQLSLLGGVNLNAELRVGQGDDFANAPLFAEKKFLISPRVPAARQANQNPTLDGLTMALANDKDADYGEPIAMPLERCASLAGATPQVVLHAGNRLRITPVETVGAREAYVTPTLSGGSRMFTESLTYQWLATYGSFSSGRTGGPRDAFGNPALLYTDYRVPNDVAAQNVTLWVVQRDERLGARWYETCFRVEP